MEAFFDEAKQIPDILEEAPSVSRTLQSAARKRAETQRPWTLDFGLWTLGFGPWTLDFGPWTPYCSLFLVSSIFFLRNSGSISLVLFLSAASQCSIAS